MRRRLIVAWVLVIFGIGLALTAGFTTDTYVAARLGLGVAGVLLAAFGLVGYDIDGGGDR